MARKVAVVAVHGVADQKPASSARSIADLLCTDKEYGSFAEVPLRIARERLEPGTLPEDADAGLRYMHVQLAGYRDPTKERDEGTVYETVRLEGRRLSDGAKVHVHEVYWADLSRAGDTWYRLLAEFYQLILHLPSLGRNGLQYAKQANGNTRPWQFAHFVQRFAVWLLTVPAALINLVLLSIGVIAMSAEIPMDRGGKGYQYAVAFALLTLFLAAIPIVALRLAKARVLVWAAWLPAVLLAGTATYFILDGRSLYKVLALEAAVVAAGACIYVAKAYDVMKKNRALPFGALAAVVMLGIAVYEIMTRNAASEAGVYHAAIATAEKIFPFIMWTWALLFLSAAVALVAGVVAALTTSRQERAAAWRATWTARFSLGMPAGLFAIFTLSIWYLVIKGIAFMAQNSAPNAEQSMKNMLSESARGFEFFALALLGFVAIALFAAAPSVLVELKHPRRSDDADSARLGRWLTKGIPLVAVGAELFTLAMLAMLLVPLNKRTLLGPEQLEIFLRVAAGGVALMIGGKYFIKTFRALVDVLLDIDNYLRESPADATPRARIAERFVSLLRHLCEWRDTDGKPYDEIIVIAHSQGTVIAADVLRYLNKVPDKRLAAINDETIKLRLFTMGSPLRQLYSEAFPYLYRWITEADAAEQMMDLSPDPTRLTVKQWANVYCSGDYVGRNIWPAPEARLWVRGRPKPGNDARVDFCAGAGAHTHYWDHNGSDVAAYLKELV